MRGQQGLKDITFLQFPREQAEGLAEKNDLSTLHKDKAAVLTGRGNHREIPTSTHKAVGNQASLLQLFRQPFVLKQEPTFLQIGKKCLFPPRFS